MLGPTVVKKSQRKVVDLGEGGSRHWDDERDCEGGVPHSTKVSVVRTIGDTVEHDDVAPTKRPLVSRDPLLNLALAHKSTCSREETLAMPQAFCAGCAVNGPAPDTLCSKCFSLFIEWAGTRAQRMTREDNCTLYALGPALDQWLEAGGVKALDAAKVAKDAMLDQWGDVMRRTM